MPQPQLFLLGPPRLIVEGEQLEIKLRKAIALIAYLATTHQSFSREVLATLFWPEASARSARASLRRLLYEINKLCGEDFLMVTQSEIAINPGLDLWLDVAEFVSCVEQGLADEEGMTTAEGLLSSTAVQQLQSGSEHYHQDFLAGFSLPDSPEFDDWQFFQREGLSQKLVQAQVALITHFEATGDAEAAIPFAQRRLSIDALDEAAHRDLMHLYASAGRYAAALRQYDECMRVLDEELGVPPSEQTQQLIAAIRQRDLPPLGRSTQQVDEQNKEEREDSAASTAASIEAPHAAASEASTQPQQRASSPTEESQPIPNNLTVHTVPFVGREWELTNLRQKLSEPTCRILTLVGPGGMGKTRLALAVAGQLLAEANAEFRDGIFFVKLASVNGADGILVEIANAMGYKLVGEGSLQAELCKHLHAKQMLLLLDNFEHLLDDADLVCQLSDSLPGIKLMLTSRETLNLYEEWFHPVNGLAIPNGKFNQNDVLHDTSTGSHAQLQKIVQSDAVQLFYQSARRAHSQFSLEDELASVVEICTLVDGVPLALELAASWLRAISCSEIVTELEKGLDILTARHRNVPARHRSMKAVLEQSWSMLEVDEQQVFLRLAPFRNGFDAEAGQAVAQCTLPLLAHLTDKSFIRYQNSRYQIHELLRQFAVDQLQEQNRLAENRAKHSDYYLSLLANKRDALFGPQPRSIARQLRHDLDNIRVAWQFAVENSQLEELQQAFEPLVELYEYLGLVSPGVSLLMASAEALEEAQSASAGLDREAASELTSQFYARALLLAIGFSSTHDVEQLKDNMNRADAACSTDLSKASIGYAQHYYLFHHQQYEAAVIKGEEALAFARSADSWFLQSSIMNILAECYVRAGKTDEALTYLESALQMAKNQSYARGHAITTSHFGVVHFYGQQLALAKRYFEEAVTAFDGLGDLRRAGTTLNNLAWTMLYIGDLDEALATANRMLTGEQINAANLNQEMGYDTLSEIYYERGEYVEAKKSAISADELAQTKKSSQYRPLYLANLGLAELAIGDYDSAEEAIATAVEFVDEQTGPTIRSKVKEVQGLYAAALGDEEKALGYLNEVCQIHTENQNRVELARIQLILGETYLEFGRVRDGQRALQSAYELANQTGRRAVAERAKQGLEQLSREGERS